MPWTVKKNGDKFCVYKKGENSPISGGCHSERSDAVKHMRALYANEGKSFNEKCSYVPVKEFSELDGEWDGRKKWIQIFPFGHWPHPVYTDTTVNRETAEQFVKNFHDNVRRQKIKTDYEHGEDKAKGSKASGEYLDMEVREDGVYGLIEFTEQAFSEIQAKEWDYFSPLFLDVWHDEELDMTYENVVIGGGLTNRPYMKDMVPINFSEAVLEEKTVKYRFKDGKWIASDNNGESWRNATTDEVAELEHSEPGTGSPPEPRTDEDDRSGDKDGAGIRRDTPPPQDTKEGSDMKLSADALKLLGLPEDADETTVNTAIETAFKDLPQLKEFAEKNAKEKKFSEDYPEEYKKMQELRQAESIRESKAFSERYERVTHTEGEGDNLVTTKTDKGPSALVLDQLQTFHKKFSEKTADTADLQNLMDVIFTDKAFVDYKEHGSSRQEEVMDGDVSDAVKAFAEKATEIMNKANAEKPGSMSWGDALVAASKKHPELAKAYNERQTPAA